MTATLPKTFTYRVGMHSAGRVGSANAGPLALSSRSSHSSVSGALLSASGAAGLGMQLTSATSGNPGRGVLSIVGLVATGLLGLGVLARARQRRLRREPVIA